MTKKLTTTIGIAALCVLGGATAGTHYLTPAQPGSAVHPYAVVQVADTASATTTLTANMSLTSGNGDYQLVMTADGDLVENSLHGISPIYHTYDNSDGNYYQEGGNVTAPSNWTVTGTYVGEDTTQIWHSGTGGNPGARAVLQGDGNFVVYSASNAVLWASNTAGHPGSTLAVQDDGNVVLYDNGTALWATKTVSTVDGHGSATVNFRSCPAAAGEDCVIIKALPSRSDITMLCWESVTPVSWATPLPSNKWFYALVDGTQDELGYINAGYVNDQIKTPACLDPTSPGSTNPPQPTPLPTSGSSEASQPAPPAPVTSEPAAPPAPATFTETVGGPTHTWSNYSNAGGNEGATIPTGQSVQVACVVQGFKVADGNTNWYRIASSPWNDAFYASSDAFYNNGATSGSLHGTPYVDPAVPAC